MARQAGFKIKHWSDDEIETLKQMKSSGHSQREIGTAIGRTKRAVENKWFWVREVAASEIE